MENAYKISLKSGKKCGSYGSSKKIGTRDSYRKIIKNKKLKMARIKKIVLKIYRKSETKIYSITPEIRPPEIRPTQR